MKDRFKAIYNKYRRYLPAAAFFGGFLWDAITLGLKIKPSDLFILLGYYLGAVLSMLIVGREIRFKFSEYTNLVLQFFLGGLFSALVIFYFKSSESLSSYILVLVLVLLLVLNEFLDKYYNRLTVSWAMFTFCGIMFFNFSLPHLVGSVHSFWFYLSTVSAILATVLIKKFCSSGSGGLTPSYVVFGLVLVLFWVNWIPPVPLVKKNMAFCHELKRAQQYTGMKEKQPWYMLLVPGPGTIHRRPDEKIFCFSSIFAPSGISTTIYHRWEFYHPALKKWTSRDRMGFQIRSGRESGYRGYTYKQNMEDGLWRVKFELRNGQVLGVKKLRLKNIEEEQLQFKEIILE
jgi:hypothetical protein